MTPTRTFTSISFALLAGLVAAGCATSGGSDSDQKLLKPTITYEDIDAGPAPQQAAQAGQADGGGQAAPSAQAAQSAPATPDGGQAAQPGQATAQTAPGQPTQPAQPAQPADPFSGCMAKQPQQGMATLDCGTTDAVIVNVVGKLTPDQIDQNFQAYAKNFPNDAKQERYTRDFGKKTAQALRLKGANYEASMLILPRGSKHTRVIACRVQQSTDWTRCKAITEQLATEGIPPKVTGADQLPRYLVARPKPSGAKSAGASEKNAPQSAANAGGTGK